MIMENWGGGRKASKSSWKEEEGEFYNGEVIQAGRDDLRWKGLIQKESRVAQRWRIKAVKEDETKLERNVMAISMTHLVPVITLESCSLSSDSGRKPFNLCNPFSFYRISVCPSSSSTCDTLLLYHLSYQYSCSGGRRAHLNQNNDCGSY